MNKSVQTNLRAATGRFLLLSALVCGLVACNGGNEGSPNAGGVSDTLAPSATMSVSGSSLGIRTPLSIVFSESMDISSLQLAGTLVDETDGGVWSTTTHTNDTLTFSPLEGGWTGAASRNIIVDASDLAGNAALTISATYEIDPLALSIFQAASVVIGQPDFISDISNQGGAAGANTLATPFGSPLVAPNGKLFVGDTNNNRVLAFSQVPTVNNASANFVLGQDNFTSTGNSVSVSSHSGPQQIVMHEGKMIVADTSASRILVYNAIPDDETDSPDVVVGQQDFNSSGFACDADSFRFADSLAVTPDGKLLVVDAGNNRVLIWDNIPTTNGQAANLVIGQPDLTTCAANGPTSSTLNSPSGIWTDGTRLIIGDSTHSRALIWNSIPTINFQPADLVLGQPTFTAGSANNGNGDGSYLITAQTLSFPYGGIHSNGTQLALTDSSNSRVLIWNTFPTTSFQAADVVIGQGTFNLETRNNVDQDDNTFNPIPSDQVLYFPTGVQFYRDKLLVTDSFNNRMLIFRSN